MSEMSAFLKMFDAAWEHPWESLTVVSKSVTSAEAAWQAECYRSELPELGWPLPGSVHWQVAHIMHCKREYLEVLRNRNRSAQPEGPACACESYEQDLAGLHAVHAAQRAALTEVKDAELDTRLSNGLTLRDFISMTIRHDIWHAGQIAVARRLWRTQVRF